MPTADDDGAEAHGHSRFIVVFVRGYTYSHKTGCYSHILQCVALYRPVTGLPLRPWRFGISLFFFRNGTHEDAVFSR